MIPASAIFRFPTSFLNNLKPSLTSLVRLRVNSLTLKGVRRVKPGESPRRCGDEMRRSRFVNPVQPKENEKASISEALWFDLRSSETSDDATLADLEANNQILVRYAGANPNGSRADIAGIRNRAGNVFGLMPHPERACDPLLGSTDGRIIFESFLS